MFDTPNPPGKLSTWDSFVLRHRKPKNLVLHMLSALLFFGGPSYAVLTGDLLGWLLFFASGFVGTAGHYLFDDGRVSFHEATSSPQIVWYNVRLWIRLVSGKYGEDIRSAETHLAVLEAQGFARPERGMRLPSLRAKTP